MWLPLTPPPPAHGGKTMASCQNPPAHHASGVTPVCFVVGEHVTHPSPNPSNPATVKDVAMSLVWVRAPLPPPLVALRRWLC